MRPLLAPGVLVVALVSGAGSQPTTPSQSPSPVGLVEIHVVAVRADGGWVSGLSAADFEVLSDGVSRPIERFSDVDRPVAATLLVDVSRSCWLQPLVIRRAIEKTLVDAVPASDRVRFGIFGGTPIVISDAATGGSEALRAAARVLDLPDAFEGVPTMVSVVDGVAATPLRPPVLRLGPSPIWDAVDAAVASLEHESARRAIILLTDGRATGNVLGLEEVLQHGVRSAVSVSVVGEAGAEILQQGGARAALIRPGAALEWLAENTGGWFTTISRPDMPERDGADAERALDRVLVRAFGDLHHAYTIGFSAATPDGQWHGVEVRVKRPGVTVRARKAYLAPSAPGR